MTLDDFVVYVILPILALAVVIVFVRLVRGPSLPDRVVAIDLMNTLGIGIVATYAIATGQSAFLDVAIAMALISFLGTVAFAYYIERRV
ncbi:MAG: cation:proton antiporter [Chloroflexi bacterium]|nr:cation:proton antiporter [Chloroflexota bacterium]